MIESSELRKNRRKRPKIVSGVYCLFDERGKIVYIGKSIDIFTRILQHAKCKDFSTYSYIELDELDQGPIEEALIHKHKPRLNKQYNSTGIPNDLQERIDSGEVILKTSVIDYDCE